MFWNNFIKLCAEKGVSPNAVARELSISSGAVTKWKNGATPQNAKLRLIADYFGVSTTELLTGEKDSIPRPSTPPFISYRHDNETAKKMLADMKGHGVFDRPQGVKIPVFGNVAAGIPISAITDIEDYEEIPADMAACGEYCALKIKGNSMEPMMLQGDTVIIKVQEDVNDGEIAVVLINGDDATCKKIKKTPEGVMLISLNAAYEPMFYNNKSIEELPVRIFGKVVELRRKLH